jgi:xylulokinase
MYIGIDLGTSSVKTVLMNDEGVIVGSSTHEVPISRPHPGWSEQDPATWVAATFKALQQLLAEQSAHKKQVKGISLSGHMHGATLLDKSGAVIRPCMLWNDTRSHVQAKALDDKPIFRKLSGNIVFPGFTAPKLLWVKTHEPAVFERVAKVLLPKDYLRFILTGEYVSEMSDAAGTSWLDPHKRDWSPELLSASGMRVDQMPRLIEGTQVSGVLKPEWADQWGLPHHVVVGGGAGDNAAAACGLGIVKPGDAFLSLGTSGVVFTSTDRFLPQAETAVHAFCHALPQTWHQMGVTLSASDSMTWLAKLLQTPVPELSRALQSPAQAGSLLFLPYLSGERTPLNDADMRGVFTGLSHQTERTQMTQAVMEGVAYSLRQCKEALEQAGSHIRDLVAVGGGANSEVWLQIMADTLGVPIKVPFDGEVGAALGAARLAQAACQADHQADHQAADQAALLDVFPSVAIKTVIEPRPQVQASYDDMFQRYKALYPLIKQGLQ